MTFDCVKLIAGLFVCLFVCLKVKSVWPIRPAFVSSFCSIKQLVVLIFSPGWDASPSQGYCIKFAGTHLYTWVERATVRVKCLSQEHNTVSPVTV